MSMRTLSCAGVIVVLAWYGGTAMLGGVSVEAEPQEAPPGGSGTPGGGVTAAARCPTYPNCYDTNGTGVYFAEDGAAGIGTGTGLQPNVIITHFNNGASRVTFDGGYFDAKNEWKPLKEPGYIQTADYQQNKNLQVISVSEHLTVPLWTLFDTTKNTTIKVTDGGLLDLKLYIGFKTEWSSVSATLEFNSVHKVQDNPTVRTYSMQWQNKIIGSKSVQYCFGAKDPKSGVRPLDGVVFQQGIDVDPVTGSLTRPTTRDVVTVSCFLGAPATVYSWGYMYHGMPRDTFYFDAGIQMKRASYCADGQYYTKTGAEIDIADDRHIHDHQWNYHNIKHLEASWAPTGAICLNYDSEHMRNKPMADFKNFDGTCKNNHQLLKPCPADPPPLQQQLPPPPPYLADGPENPLSTARRKLVISRKLDLAIWA